MPSYYQILKQAREYYFSIGSLTCPALNNAFIFSNRKGFRHFLRKKTGLRPIEDQIRRFKLLPHVVEVINSTNSNATYTKGIKFDFWSISGTTKNGAFIKVIIIKNDEGKHYFFSIMD